ncbi:TetR/AcrR family transcriptional regulator [Arhodomonas sp. AD133]|uniref:TetR/AcrR family transcriptional regulator n=1 Tax=Arhodomonas sp. AD133 TaxID=3415009 RepID=UPI003EB812CF
MTDDRTPTPGRKRPLRERVLDAAERVVSRDGAAHLTLDAVVAEAGVSKGGMLYHFNSKQALLEGLLERTLAHHEGRIAEARESLPDDDPYREGRAHLLACIDHELVDPELGITLIAAAAHHPDMVEPARRMEARCMAAIDALEKAVPTARLLWLAMHGMQFLDILGISSLTDEQKQALRRQARAHLDDEEPRP